jgi:uncharacterized lipoprotein YajG
MAVKIGEKNGKRWLFVGAALLIFAGCAAPRSFPEPAALEAKAELRLTS